MKNFSGMSKNQGGFTLIEIAIVLVIIGLLIGGVLQGQQLIENSRVRAATNDINGTMAGAYSYVDRYGRFPGDDGPTATIQARGGNWATIVGGNQNGILEGTAAQTFAPTAAIESALMWQHLRAAGFISGDPLLTGVQALPRNPFGGLIGVTSALVQPAGAGGLPGNKVCMSNVPGSAAIAMDTRLDDGNPATGRFRSTLGVAGANTAPGATAANYVENEMYSICYRM
ncbi:MAG: prepilin-type N-terminal cleavage/methylation domain-containing protein [Pseudohongiella sp.]|nr:prepilin-type N-terminal cleavage/methylation domain-containing protein [Pseudohongiella sp.]MDO9519883.1 prepilin-type N-terminal cleavage/methylation domain-containing protein [Pseudohongiella sp.]MDP2126814.1 prepilin-type N-terminal cleavage/methylation domain-containing protein [Pseudohongiella sp.]